MITYDEYGDDGNWCPDCGEMRGVCMCAALNKLFVEAVLDSGWDCEKLGHMWQDGPEGKTYECVVCGEVKA